MEPQRISEIPGWGIDIPKANRPGVPREKNVDPESNGVHWQAMDRQQPPIKIYQTIEKQGLTPVFGTTCPPKGLSGKIRDKAYKYGEDRIRRWALLLLADRVDMVESQLEEIAFGREPQSEEQRKKRKNIVYGVGAGLSVAAVGLFLRSRKKSKE